VDDSARPRAATSHTATAVLLISGAVIVNAAFAGLGAVFDHPDVLEQPAGEVLASFRDSQQAIVAQFRALAAGAALLAPIAVRLRRLSDSRAMRTAVPVGVLAALVQVVGLSRWPLLVPALARRAADPAQSIAAEETFTALGRVLGTAVGATSGYVLTASWTALAVVALRSTIHPNALVCRLFLGVGSLPTVLIVLGVLVPLGVPGTDTFVGYLVWSAWLIGLAVVLLMRGRVAPGPGRAR